MTTTPRIDANGELADVGDRYSRIPAKYVTGVYVPWPASRDVYIAHICGRGATRVAAGDNPADARRIRDELAAALVASYPVVAEQDQSGNWWLDHLDPTPAHHGGTR